MTTRPLRTVHDLEGLRDELRLQLHLMSAELRDQYHELEHRFTAWRRTASGNLDHAGKELGEAYQRLRERMNAAGAR